MKTHRITVAWADLVGGSVSAVIESSSDAAVEADVTIPADAAAYEVDVAFNRARLKSFYLLSDQDLTLKTNDSGEPVDEISVKAGVPKIWTNQHPETNPFTADVTKLYIDNLNAEAAATVNLRVLYDATPA